MAVRVMRFPQTVVNSFTENPFGSVKRRRAAAYARVSSDHSDQLTSCAVQVDYYTSYIKSRSDLEFVKVYTDEGISGTSMAHRTGFNQMIADALEGKIDLIITKSVSRFARNTVDGLTTIRLLKENKVECYFERENIRTFDSKGELLLTIMASIAQEEARSVSENCTWGQRKRFSDGKVTVPFKRFLGYERGADGALTVAPEQAETVREIYRLFLGGMSPYAIAKYLTEHNIPSPGGKSRWYKATVTSILSNEKYKGDALLQKVYTTDFLTKRKKRNEGELPQYYVEGDHEAIIPPEIFGQAQAELERRRSVRESAPDPALDHGTDFSPKLICGQCGGPYFAQTLYSTHKYRKTLLKCPNCENSPHLIESEAEAVFIKAVNLLFAQKEQIIAKSANLSKRMESTKALEKERAELAAAPSNAEALEKERAELAAAPNNAEALAELDRRIENLIEQKRKQRLFRKALKGVSKPLCSFDGKLFGELIDHITCNAERDIRVVFNDGTEIKVEI